MTGRRQKLTENKYQIKLLCQVPAMTEQPVKISGRD